MRLTIKLYAGLTDYLPESARNNRFTADVPEGQSAYQVMDRYNVPRDLAYLVLVNGVYIKPEERGRPLFNDGDVLAIWPPIAGG